MFGALVIVVLVVVVVATVVLVVIISIERMLVHASFEPPRKS